MNVIKLFYTKKLELIIIKIEVIAQKIDRLSLKTVEMIISDFQIQDKFD